MAEHLNEHARAALDLSSEERIARIRHPRWIGYTRAKQVLTKLEDLRTHPKTHRMPNLLVFGETNNGKSMIATRFSQMHPPSDNAERDHAIFPVLIVQAPPVPDENRFYNAVLETLNAPYRPSDVLAKKQFQVLRLLRQVRLEILIVDEIHHLLAGHTAKQRQFLNVLKYLGNELQAPIVGIGTRDAVRAVQSDPQLANRFEPTGLPRWEMNEDFLMLLASPGTR